MKQKKDSYIDAAIRINHAGEYAAKRIYEGQLSSIKDEKTKELILDMAKGEEKHLSYFEQELVNRKIRPTILYPLVDKLAYGLGKITAMMGKETAMICTSAVENVIADHYQNQIDYLSTTNEMQLTETISQFREDELEHKDTAETYNLNLAPAYKALDSIIQTGCKTAIKLVKYL